MSKEIFKIINEIKLLSIKDKIGLLLIYIAPPTLALSLIMIILYKNDFFKKEKDTEKKLTYKDWKSKNLNYKD